MSGMNELINHLRGPGAWSHVREQAADTIDALTAERDALQAKVDAIDAPLARLMECFPEPCRLDHHGYCQEHFLHDTPCPVGVLKALHPEGDTPT